MSKAELNRAELSKVERERGFFGEFGGQFVPEGLKQALDYLAEAYIEAKTTLSFAKS